MRSIILIAPLLAVTGCGSLKLGSSGSAALTTDDQKIIYAIGLNMARPLGQLSLTPEEMAVLQRGISDQVAGKPEIKLEEWGPKINQFAEARMGKASENEKVKGAAFVDKAAKEAGAVRLPSGVVYKEITAGTGATPTASSIVRAHYKGTLIDGKEFDSSYGKDPIEIPLTSVVPCWTEGFQKMKVGGKAQLVCPSDQAYGDRGAGSDIPPGATLIFDVELLDVKNP
jgi:FKBP-type peptidyl-prolyl cis-trans isomerase FkpA